MENENYCIKLRVGLLLEQQQNRNYIVFLGGNRSSV